MRARWLEFRGAVSGREFLVMLAPSFYRRVMHHIITVASKVLQIEVPVRVIMVPCLHLDFPYICLVIFWHVSASRIATRSKAWHNAVRTSLVIRLASLGRSS